MSEDLKREKRNTRRIDVDETQLREVCARWHSGEITAVAAQKELKLNARTFYRKVKERGLSKAAAYVNNPGSRSECQA